MLTNYQRSLKYGSSFYIFCLLSTVYCLLLCLSSCAVNRTIESHGDKTLRDIHTIKPNHYIGRSESLESFDKSLQNAIAHAQTQIIQDLGVNISLELTDKYKSISVNDFSEVASLTSSDILIEGSHNVQTKINRIYTEKKTYERQVFYTTWVEVFFDKTRFLRGHDSFWQAEIVALKLPERANIDSRFINNYTRLLELKKSRYDSESRYLSAETSQAFMSLYDRYNSIFTSQIRYISLENTASAKKFSNQFVFKVSNRSTGNNLPDLPLRINNVLYFTDSAGQIQYTADYNNDISISIGNNLTDYINPLQAVIYKNDTFSPLKNKNVTLLVKSDNKNVEFVFGGMLSENGYNISTVYDLLLNIKPTINTKQISVNQYITELSLEILFLQNGRAVRTTYFPANRREYITGYGQSREQSLVSAINLEYFSQKSQMVEEIERVVREILMRF